MFHPPQGIGASPRYSLIASENVLARDDTEYTIKSSSYTEIKRVRLFAMGSVRTYVEMCTDRSLTTIYARVTRNGVQVGDAVSTSSSTYVAFTWDTPGWTEFDYYRLESYNENYAYYAWLRNWRLKGDVVIATSPPVLAVEK